MALPLMNVQLLWLLAQDPAQMEPFNILLGMGGGTYETPPLDEDLLTPNGCW